MTATATEKPFDIEPILALPAGQRFAIAQRIWDSLSEDPIEIDDELRKEIRRRMDVYRADPSKVYSWEQVKEHIRAAKSNA